MGWAAMRRPRRGPAKAACWTAATPRRSARRSSAENGELCMLQGGCACGAVRYRLKTQPMIVHCCHCRDCQRQTGGPCAVNALIETDRIELLGEAPVAIS